MPKGKRKTTYSKRSPLQLALLLVKFSLIKIGSIPILMFQILIQVTKTVKSQSRKSVSTARNPSLIRTPLYFPDFSLLISHFSFPRRSRGPGRPRKRSLLSIYYQRYRFFVRTRVARKTKVILALTVFSLLFFSYTFFTVQLSQLLPSPTRLSSPGEPLTTEFFDRNGKLLYRLYEGRNRTLVKLENLPPYLKQATIAIEDKNFYKHSGVDFAAIARAIRSNLNTGSTQGASTITQQLVKNSLLSPEKTYSRKIKEIFLSFWAERIYSKNEILQMYFNEAPYGGTAWGVEAASEMYFGKPAHDLDLAEASFLAGLPASPTEYSPWGSDPQLARIRQKQVLDRMVEDKYITKSDADQALSQQLSLKSPLSDIKAPHFVMYLRDLLSQKYGYKTVSEGGLKIKTTLDLGLQEAVQEIVKDEVDKLAPLNVKNGAAMVADGKTGQILAMVGSKDYNEPNFGNYNATLALRQPGSSIKVITYITGFKQGFSPGNSILDVPVRFSDAWGNSYAPVNYDGNFHGPVSIRTALGSSYNIPAVKMLATVGVDNMIQTAKDMGITTFTEPKRYGLSLTLGGGEVKMIDMIAVYGTLAKMGDRMYPTPILKVTDSNGNTLEEYEDHSQTVIQPEIAYLITDILSDNSARTPAFGPNSLLNIPVHKVAVKTGTSDNKKDNWTFGYTPEFVVGVWVGNNDSTPMNPALTSGVTGAAPIWNRIMKGILSTREPVAFIRPAGVADVTIDGRHDLAVSGILPKGLVRVAKQEDKTMFFDAFSSYATASAITSAHDGTRN